MYASYWRNLPDTEKTQLASMLKTSTEYLRLIMSGHKKAGAVLARKIEEQTKGTVRKSILRPDIYPPQDLH